MSRRVLSHLLLAAAVAVGAVLGFREAWRRLDQAIAGAFDDLSLDDIDPVDLVDALQGTVTAAFAEQLGLPELDVHRHLARAVDEAMGDAS